MHEDWDYGNNLDKEFFKMSESMVMRKLPRSFVCIFRLVVEKWIVDSAQILSASTTLQSTSARTTGMNIQSFFIVLQDPIVKILTGRIVLRRSLSETI